LENAKELVEEFKREHREEVKELRRQEQEEEERSSVRNYLGNSQQNYYMVGKEEVRKQHMWPGHKRHSREGSRHIPIGKRCRNTVEWRMY